jgi:hypothetical protein
VAHDGVAGERSDLCDLGSQSWLAGFGDAACKRHHARAEGWPDQHLRGCLSSAAGRGNTGLWALSLTGGPRWYGSQGDPQGRGDVGAARTPRNLDPREAGWGSACDCLLSLALPPPRRRIIQGCVFPRAAVRVRRRAVATGCARTRPPGGQTSCLVVTGRRRSHRTRPDLVDMQVMPRQLDLSCTVGRLMLKSVSLASIPVALMRRWAVLSGRDAWATAASFNRWTARAAAGTTARHVGAIACGPGGGPDDRGD